MQVAAIINSFYCHKTKTPSTINRLPVKLYSKSNITANNLVTIPKKSMMTMQKRKSVACSIVQTSAITRCNTRAENHGLADRQ